MNQLWRARRDLYRPAGEAINRVEYEITETRFNRIVKDFIVTHHYSSLTLAIRGPEMRNNAVDVRRMAMLHHSHDAEIREGASDNLDYPPLAHGRDCHYKKSAPDIIRARGVRIGFASSRAEDAVVHFAVVIGP